MTQIRLICTDFLTAKITKVARRKRRMVTDTAFGFSVQTSRSYCQESCKLTEKIGVGQPNQRHLCAFFKRSLSKT
jgi:hypothetical protein